MVLSRFTGTTKGGGEDVATLIAKRNYTRAIEVIREQLLTRRNDPRLRLQLADVLVSAGKAREAVTILLPLADEFAKDGFAAKAISVLKKVQKLEPGRRDIDSRLANLIQEKQQHATIVVPMPSSPGLEIGMEEIGLDPPPSAPEPPRRREVEPAPPRPAPAPPAPVPAPAPRPAAAPAPAPSPPRPAPPAATAPRAPEPALSAEPELSLESAPELDLTASSSPAAESAPVVDTGPGPEFDLGMEGSTVEEAPLDLALEPLPALEPEAPPPAPMAATPVVDQDLFTGEFESVEPMVEVEATVEPEPAVTDPMSDSRFADELFSVLENAFQEAPAQAAAAPDEAPPAGAEIVVSPLFKDFSVDELVAVIAGLKLLTFERGNVILREGEPGHSLYMLTAGTVKAFVKRDGKQVPIAELEEGAFFGEGSILTGKPRTATIVAKEHCELLELDRPTLDGITQTHPHVLDVLQEFANQRMPK